MLPSPFEGMRAQVPGRASDWDERLDAACESMRVAAQAVVDSPTPDNLKAIDAARRVFGAGILALDKKRRPTFYGLA